MVKTSGLISSDGKKTFLYKSQINDICIKFDKTLQVRMNKKSEHV